MPVVGAGECKDRSHKRGLAQAVSKCQPQADRLSTMATNAELLQTNCATIQTADWDFASLGGVTRDNTNTAAAVMQFGVHLVITDQSPEGVSEMIDVVQDQAAFSDGAKLVTVHQPVR